MNNKELGLLFKAISHILDNQKAIMESVCPEKFYQINSTDELAVLSGELAKAYYNGDNTLDINL